MGNFSKWQKENTGSYGLRVVLLVDRNKDNKHLKNFKERRRSYLTTKSNEELKKDFDEFVSSAKPGVTSRMYLSLNRRDNTLVQKELQHLLLDQEIPMQALASKCAGIAAGKNCKSPEDSFMFFDIDTKDPDFVKAFTNDVITEYENTMLRNPKLKKEDLKPFYHHLHETKNGYAFIYKQRFDKSNLMKKYPDVDFKQDDLLLTYWN